MTPRPRRWYTELVGIEPYFVGEIESQPACIEFRMGDYQHELGYIDRRYASAGRTDQPGGTVTYRAVDHIRATAERWCPYPDILDRQA